MKVISTKVICIKSKSLDDGIKLIKNRIYWYSIFNDPDDMVYYIRESQNGSYILKIKLSLFNELFITFDEYRESKINSILDEG